MADDAKKTPSSTSSPSTTSSTSSKSLAPAGESTDPEVHRLLAERQSAVSNLAAATPDETAKAKADEARKQIDAVDKQLADLGFSAG